MTAIRHACLAACITLMLANAAHAADDIGSASAQLANLRYTLVDLDPNDGIAPGLTITSPGLLATVGNVIAGVGVPQVILAPTLPIAGASGVFAPYEPFVYDTVMGNESLGFSGALDASSAVVKATGNTLSVTATTNPGVSTGWSNLQEVNADTNLYSFNYNYRLGARGVLLSRDVGIFNELGGSDAQLVLTPNTRLVIEAEAETSAFANSASLAGALADARQRFQSLIPAGSASENFDAEARGQVELALFQQGSFVAGDGLFSNLQIGEFGMFDDATGLTLPEQRVSSQRTLSLSFDNTDSMEATLSLNIYANAIASQRVSTSAWITLPEPGTWAMMGLGLVGLAAAARRKRQAA